MCNNKKLDWKWPPSPLVMSETMNIKRIYVNHIIPMNCNYGCYLWPWVAGWGCWTGGSTCWGPSTCPPRWGCSPSSSLLNPTVSIWKGTFSLQKAQNCLDTWKKCFKLPTGLAVRCLQGFCADGCLKGLTPATHCLWGWQSPKFNRIFNKTKGKLIKVK